MKSPIANMMKKDNTDIATFSRSLINIEFNLEI